MKTVNLVRGAEAATSGSLNVPAVKTGGTGANGGVPTTSGGTANAATASGLKLDLKTTQAANEVIESLQTTGELPSNYVTKAEAMQNGWQPGKALNNTNPGGQLGGDVFANSTNILPSANGRIWYEADIGLAN